MPWLSSQHQPWVFWVQIVWKYSGLTLECYSPILITFLIIKYMKWNVVKIIVIHFYEGTLNLVSLFLSSCTTLVLTLCKVVLIWKLFLCIWRLFGTSNFFSRFTSFIFMIILQWTAFLNFGSTFWGCGLNFLI